MTAPPNKKVGRLTRTFVAVSLTLFALSLVLPAIGPLDGLTALALGPFSLLIDPVWFLPWFANLLFAGALTLAWFPRWHRLSSRLSAATCIGALVALLPDKIVYDESGSTMGATPHLGYTLWLASHALLWLGLLLSRNSRPS